VEDLQIRQMFGGADVRIDRILSALAVGSLIAVHART
jgi:hypothetical protein